MTRTGADWAAIPAWRPAGFVRIAGIVNAVTGETVPVDYEIHADDMDRMLQGWQELFELDWRIHQAEQERCAA